MTIPVEQQRLIASKKHTANWKRWVHVFWYGNGVLCARSIRRVAIHGNTSLTTMFANGHTAGVMTD